MIYYVAIDVAGFAFGFRAKDAWPSTWKLVFETSSRDEANTFIAEHNAKAKG